MAIHWVIPWLRIPIYKSMKRLLVSFALVLLGVGSACADTIVTLADEATITLPDGWVATSETGEYPFLIAHIEHPAELQIFVSEIYEDATIDSESDLKNEVDQVIEDVILELPQAQLLTSTGRADDSHASFSLEFLSIDEESGLELRHRLNGIIYRHPDGSQRLFTLWAKTTDNSAPMVDADLRLMQGSFEYKGPQAAAVFETKSRPEAWFLVMLAIGATLFIYLHKRKPRHNGSAPA